MLATRTSKSAAWTSPALGPLPRVRDVPRGSPTSAHRPLPSRLLRHHPRVRPSRFILVAALSAPLPLLAAEAAKPAVHVPFSEGRPFAEVLKRAKAEAQTGHARRRRLVVRALQDHGQDDVRGRGRRRLGEEVRRARPRRRREGRGPEDLRPLPGVLLPDRPLSRRRRERDRPSRRRLPGGRLRARRRRHPRRQDAAPRGARESPDAVEPRGCPAPRERPRSPAGPGAAEADRPAARLRGGRPRPAGDLPALRAARRDRDARRRLLARDGRPHRDVPAAARKRPEARIFRRGVRDGSRKARRRRDRARGGRRDPRRRRRGRPL